MDSTHSPSWKSREYLYPTENTRESSGEKRALALSGNMFDKNIWIKKSISKRYKHSQILPYQ